MIKIKDRDIDEEIKKSRFSCLTPAQQDIFNSWNLNQRRYALFRSQGYDKANAYRMAGYNCKQASQNGYKLEHGGCPQMLEIIQALSGQSQRLEALKQGSLVSNYIDNTANKNKPIEQLTLDNLPKVPKESPVLDIEKFDLSEISPEQCRNIKFFREIANGTIKSVKITKYYDADGNLKSKKVEETSDIDTRIKAQKEVMRMVGLTDVIELGKVEANNINIMIVDASKKEEVNDSRNKVDIPLNIQEIDGEKVVVVDEVDGNIKDYNKEIKDNDLDNDFKEDDE